MSTYASPLHSPTAFEDGTSTQSSHFGLLHPNASQTSIGLGISTPTLNGNYPFPTSPSFSFSSPNLNNLNTFQSTLPISSLTSGSRPGQVRRVSRMEEKESEIASKHALSAPPSMLKRIRSVPVWRWFSLAAWLGEGLAAKWLEDCFAVFWPAVVCFLVINLTYSW
jgi:hypothetical protein